MSVRAAQQNLESLDGALRTRSLEAHRHNVLDDEMFAAFEADMLDILMMPGVREWWQANQARYTPRVRDRINARLQEDAGAPPPILDQVVNWRDRSEPDSAI